MVRSCLIFINYEKITRAFSNSENFDSYLCLPETEMTEMKKQFSLSLDSVVFSSCKSEVYFPAPDQKKVMYVTQFSAYMVDQMTLGNLE